MRIRFTTSFALIAGLTLAACQPRDTETAADVQVETPDFALMNEAYDAATNAGGTSGLSDSDSGYWGGAVPPPPTGVAATDASRSA